MITIENSSIDDNTLIIDLGTNDYGSRETLSKNEAIISATRLLMMAVNIESKDKEKTESTITRLIKEKEEYEEKYKKALSRIDMLENNLKQFYKNLEPAITSLSLIEEKPF